MATIYDGMKGIPIDYLVSAPLMAAARSNLALAENMEEFIAAVAFEEDGKTTKLLKFSLQRPYQDANTKELKVETIQVQAPLLGLVPIPALLVDNVTIDFTTEVKTSEATKSDVSSTVSAKYGFGSFSVSAEVSASISNTRSSDQSAKYTFHVQATQQPGTEGMAKLMDVMAACTAPIPTSGGGG